MRPSLRRLERLGADTKESKLSTSTRESRPLPGSLALVLQPVVCDLARGGPGHGDSHRPVRPSPPTATARIRSVCDPQVVVSRSTSASSLETWLTTLKFS